MSTFARPSPWQALRKELDCWNSRGLKATFWIRDDDASTVSAALDRLCALGEKHNVNIALAVVPGKLDQVLVNFLESTKARFHPMCHGWMHVNYGPPGKAAEFGPERPLAALLEDGRLAFEKFAENFGADGVVFVPPFNRITPAMVEKLPELGFLGVSAEPASLERRLSRILSQVSITPLSIKLPTKAAVPHFDVQIDLIDWKKGSARQADSVGLEIVGHLRLRRLGFIPPEVPIGLLMHHLVHDDAVWALCDELIGSLIQSGSMVFSHARLISSRGLRYSPSVTSPALGIN